MVCLLADSASSYSPATCLTFESSLNAAGVLDLARLLTQISRAATIRSPGLYLLKPALDHDNFVQDSISAFIIWNSPFLEMACEAAELAAALQRSTESNTSTISYYFGPLYRWLRALHQTPEPDFADERRKFGEAMSGLAISERDQRYGFRKEVFEPNSMEVQRHLAYDNISLPQVMFSSYYRMTPGSSLPDYRDFVVGNAMLNYIVLDHPQHQIRLLSRNTNDSWDLSVWHINTAPPYAALSYEWGRFFGPRSLVQVDGSTLPVTPNCAVALRQLWARKEFDYFWIDAICIDQRNGQEKGHQVQAMAEIYTSATCTFVSLGAHNVHSSRLFNALGYYDQAVEGIRLTSLLSTNATQVLDNAIVNFGFRTYWIRLWVYQELILSRDLRLMCGDDMVTWTSFARLFYEFKECWWYEFRESFKPKLSLQILKDVLDRRSTPNDSDPALDLYRLLDSTRERECYDPRDRVFGILRLIRWPQNISTIVVDYRHSLFHVAINVLQHSPSSSLNAIERAVALVDRLRIPPGAYTEVGEEHMAALAAAPLLSKKVAVSHATLLRRDADGYLEVDSLDSHGPLGSRHKLRELDASVSSSQIWESFQPLLLESDILGYVSVRCMSGDILIELGKDKHLVIRAVGGSNYKIIGHAILNPGAYISRNCETCKMQYAYEIHLHAYDWLAWACDMPANMYNYYKVSKLFAEDLEKVQRLAKKKFESRVICLVDPDILLGSHYEHECGTAQHATEALARGLHALGWM